MHCTACPILFHLMTMTKFPIRIPWGISYIDLIFSGKTNQQSVKWGDSRDTRVSNYSAKSLVLGGVSLFSYQKKWFSCFHANVSLLMVISICNPSAVSEIWLPPSQKNWNCAIVLYWKKTYISIIKLFEQILWNKWNRCFKRALLNIILTRAFIM